MPASEWTTGDHQEKQRREVEDLLHVFAVQRIT